MLFTFDFVVDYGCYVCYVAFTLLRRFYYLCAAPPHCCLRTYLYLTDYPRVRTPRCRTRVARCARTRTADRAVLPDIATPHHLFCRTRTRALRCSLLPFALPAAGSSRCCHLLPAFRHLVCAWFTYAHRRYSAGSGSFRQQLAASTAYCIRALALDMDLGLFCTAPHCSSPRTILPAVRQFTSQPLTNTARSLF